ncbi:hypothetical protein QJS64_00660 [Paraclostridium bifermentans]|uniref:Uncharacterized protein n=1 Tax=Paraclostridium bifermentans TaxID=1490 RepID=A0ABY8R392_PARBF|nr:hypothetical protein QJS64_00660 [Paraclostridium bifermentans]
MQDGFLTVSVVDSTTNFPVVDANVNVYSVGDDNKASTVVFQNLKTDISGQVVGLNLAAPDLIYSQQPSDVRPYSQYIVEVTKDGYETIIINGTQVLATVIAQQGIQMNPRQRSKCLYSRQNEIVVDIGPHTLWGPILLKFLKVI